MEKEIIISNEIKDLYHRVKSVFESMDTVFDEDILQAIEMGLYELVLNGIEHGNLGITFFEKDRACQDRTYDILLDRRMAIQKNKEKYVIIRYKLNKGNVCFSVEDEGKGFDWKKTFLEGTKDNLRPNGRGILLAKSVFDDLRYNVKGNLVTAQKIL